MASSFTASIATVALTLVFELIDLAREVTEGPEVEVVGTAADRGLHLESVVCLIPPFVEAFSLGHRSGIEIMSCGHQCLCW
jgi:hypothetical protein